MADENTQDGAGEVQQPGTEQPPAEVKENPSAAIPPPQGDMIPVPSKMLADMQAKMLELETKDANRDAEMEGLRAIAERAANGGEEGTTKLRERKNFEPKFRTVRLRKMPIAGDFDNMGIVSGWTKRGAYQQVDRTGIAPTIVDFIDVIFAGHEKNPETGNLQAEKIRLLDLMNSEQVVCKVIGQENDPHKVPTGEEISVMEFDPKHGLTPTGDMVDGYTAYDDITYTLQIPGVSDALKVNGAFVNS